MTLELVTLTAANGNFIAPMLLNVFLLYIFQHFNKHVANMLRYLTLKNKDDLASNHIYTETLAFIIKCKHKKQNLNYSSW